MRSPDMSSTSMNFYLLGFSPFKSLISHGTSVTSFNLCNTKIGEYSADTEFADSLPARRMSDACLACGSNSSSWAWTSHRMAMLLSLVQRQEPGRFLIWGQNRSVTEAANRAMQCVPMWIDSACFAVPILEKVTMSWLWDVKPCVG